MTPAERESLRLVLDRTHTPPDAVAWRLLLSDRVDDCQACGAVHWARAEEIETSRPEQLARAGRRDAA